MNILPFKLQLQLDAQLNLKTHHSKSKVIPTKKRRNTQFYRLRLFNYNMLLKDLPNPSNFDYLDNIDTYIENWKRQTKTANNHRNLMLKRPFVEDD